MNKEFFDEKHQEQAHEFIFELGQFTLSFERVCEVMRNIIMFSLRSQGLKNQGIEQVIVGGKASAELQMLLGAVYSELPGHDELDKKCVQQLLKAIKDITEKRNILLHSSWNLGNHAIDPEFYAVAIKYKPQQKSGSGIKVHEYSALELRNLSNELKRIQVLLQRLQYCITQVGFKVSSEFSKQI